MKFSNKTLKLMGAKAAPRRGRGAYRSDSMIVMDEDGSLNAKATAQRIKNDPLYKGVLANYNKMASSLPKIAQALEAVQAIFQELGYQNENSNNTEQLDRDFYVLMEEVRKAGGKWGDPNLRPIAELYAMFNRIKSDLHGPIQHSRWARENANKMKDAFKPIS